MEYSQTVCYIQYIMTSRMLCFCHYHMWNSSNENFNEIVLGKEVNIIKNNFQGRSSKRSFHAAADGLLLVCHAHSHHLIICYVPHLLLTAKWFLLNKPHIWIY